MNPSTAADTTGGATDDELDQLLYGLAEKLIVATDTPPQAAPAQPAPLPAVPAQPAPLPAVPALAAPIAFGQPGHVFRPYDPDTGRAYDDPPAQAVLVPPRLRRLNYVARARARRRHHLADDEDEPPAGMPADEPVQRRRRGVREGAFDREAEGLTPIDGLPWSKASHSLCAPRLLTADDPRHPNPVGFRGELYAPQATLLRAMIDLERRPLLQVFDAKCPDEWAALLQTKCGRISERFSFGKTVLSLALVCAQRAPARLPEISPLATYALTGGVAQTHNRASIITGFGGSSNYDVTGSGFLPEITVRYPRFLPITIVAAAANVISQWEENTQRFTSLRYFIVENVRSLREFEQMFRRGQLVDYDLLFVKAGRVTTSFTIAGEPKFEGKSKNRSLFGALARVLEGVPVARLIIDDFDTLKLGSDDCFVPAFFTWLVSATRRLTTARAVLHGGDTVENFFRANLSLSFPILGAALDDVLNKACSLHCAPSYVDAHISSTAIGFRRIFVQGGAAAAMLRDLEVPEEVVEMINADAVGTAAQALNMTATSVSDVIHRVVGSHLDKLRHAIRALNRVENARTELGLRAPAEQDRERIKDLRAALKDGNDAEAAAALWAVSGGGKDVLASLASLEEWAAGEKEKHGKALARMRDNVREGHCQCCMVPFEKGGGGEAGEAGEAAYVLASCCQIIVCETCITKKEGQKKTFIKRCPNCARDIKLETGLVRVGAELDLEACLKDETVTGAAPEEPAPNPAADPAAGSAVQAKVPIDNAKLKALVQLVSGSPVECLRDVAAPPYVEGLLHGQRNAPWPADKPKSYLVFTMHAESTKLIATTLEELKIPFCQLRGTRAQKDEAVRQAADGEVRVMLVTAPKDCGGLNLPFLSHIVFYHRIVDRNVEAQVAARGQRLGRAHNLEILTIINETEAAGMPLAP